MITLTRIFQFETAHAIYGYPGQCRNIHGHSYELQVTVSASENVTGYIPAPGFILDFKKLKQIVNEAIIEKLDHKLVLSKEYLSGHREMQASENLVKFDAEPTAENLLIFIQKELQSKLPDTVQLSQLILYETKNAFATWSAG